MEKPKDILLKEIEELESSGKEVIIISREGSFVYSSSGKIVGHNEEYIQIINPVCKTLLKISDIIKIRVNSQGEQK